ncbi:MAG: glucose-1-phosphate thymidylyltransferase [Planctomycetota bacterium]|nr:glucose-1-phosphate thymidylyltransferase [Planctomycetota bacterium]
MVAHSVLFDLAKYRFADVFAPGKPVWDVIGKINSHAKRLVAAFSVARKPRGVRSKGSSAGMPFGAGWHSLAGVARKGCLVARTTVLHAGKTLTGGFKLEPGDVTKGKFRVLVHGKVADGAVVVFGGAVLFDGGIVIGPGTVIEPGALIKGPTVIGERTEVRQGAYVRGGCIFGDRCVVGHATEVKDSVFLDDAKAGHFAYVGDSVLGNGVNLGAGTKLANLKIIDAPVRLHIDGGLHDTGLRKFGAILGDGCELGCNSVTSPGTVLGKGSLVYPCVNVPSGVYGEKTVVNYAHDALRVRGR